VDETTPSAAILIVDDDAEVLALLTAALRAEGYAAIPAATIERALVLLRETPSLRLLISDVRMSAMSGIELADRAQAILPGLKVILMSGWFLPPFVERRFLKKPFSTEDLIAAVAEEMGHASDSLSLPS
jgi:DNA-binding NtrC family response regulator